jgi:hypothetical protein
MEWLAQLEGDKLDLEDLPRWFSQLDHKVRSEDGKYYLASSAFQYCATTTAVWELAEQIVERMNGAARALEPGFRPARVGTEIVQVYDDGTRQMHRRVQVFGTELRMKTGAITVFIDGKPLPPQPSKQEKLVAQWEAEGHESALGRALRIGLLPQQTWGSLYHVYEVVKHDVSGEIGDWKALLPLLPNDPQLGDQLDRFRKTANDPAHAGMHARHGRPEPNPTPDPMTLAEAQSLIRRLLVAWLSRKI